MKPIEEDAAALEELKEDIKRQMYDAWDIVQAYNGAIAARARSYWFAQIISILDDDHDWIGGSMCRMQDTIDEIREWHENQPTGEDE